MWDNSFDNENLSGQSIEDDRETKNQIDKEIGKNKSEEQKKRLKLLI